jgi:type VI secretion system secreted protein Hcp
MLRDSRALKSARLVFYRINDSGQERPYYTIHLDNVRIGSLIAVMPNIKDKACVLLNHTESVQLFYDSISWHYHDGNLKVSDSLQAARETSRS